MTGRPQEFRADSVVDQFEDTAELRPTVIELDVESLRPVKVTDTPPEEPHDNTDTPKSPELHPETEEMVKMLAATKMRHLVNTANDQLRARRFEDGNDMAQDAFATFMKTYRDRAPLPDRTPEELIFTVLNRRTADRFRRMSKHDSMLTYVDGMDGAHSDKKELLLTHAYEAALDPADNSTAEEIIKILFAELTEQQQEVLRETTKELDERGKLDGTTRVRKLRAMVAVRSVALRLHQSGEITLPNRLAKEIESGNLFQTKTQQEHETRLNKVNTPKHHRITAEQLQKNAARFIRERRDDGDRELAVHITEFIGQWTVAALAIRDYLDASNSSKMNAAIIWEDESRLDEIAAFVGPILGPTRSRVAIDTSYLIGELAPKQGFDFLVTANALDPGHLDNIKSEKAFLLSLTPSEGNLPQKFRYVAPEYREVGSNMDWEPSDSVRLAQEWYLATGNVFDKPSKPYTQKRGPTPARLLKHTSLEELSVLALEGLGVDWKAKHSEKAEKPKKTKKNRKNQ